MMTTADGMHPAFSGRHPNVFLISDLYPVDTEIAEVQVHYTPVTLLHIKSIAPKRALCNTFDLH